MPHFTGSTPTRSVRVSSDPAIQSLQDGGSPGLTAAWASQTITYSFPSGTAFFFGGGAYANGEVAAGWMSLSEYERGAVRLALAEWEAVANIRFVEVQDGTNVGDLRFAFTKSIVGANAAHAYLPSGAPWAGDVWINPVLHGQSFARGTDNFHTLLHEIGHALGLSHPMELPGHVRTTPALEADFDGFGMFTIMSYDSPAFEHNTAHTPMLLDVAAIQAMYGANTNSRGGDDGYSLAESQLIWDTGGSDTVYLPPVQGGSDALIDLNDDSASRLVYLHGRPPTNDPTDYAVLTIPFGVMIENAVVGATGTAVRGNELNNLAVFTASGGGSFDGGAGTDSLAVEGAGHANLRKAGGGFVVDAPGRSGGAIAAANVERFLFSDGNVAVGSDGMGRVAKILGAVFAAESLSNAEYAGIGISLTDSGMSYAELISLALDARLGSGYSVESEVSVLYTNVIGVAPNADELSYYTGLVNSGQFNRQTLAIMAAETEQNIEHIGLGSLLDQGLFYLA